MALEGEKDNFMYNPLLDIETESDQPAPPSRLTHGFHSHHTQLICSPHASHGHHHPSLAHSQLSFTTMQPPPTTCSPTQLHLYHAAMTVHKALTAHPCSRPQPHAHPYNFTSTTKPQLFTNPTQLTHAATPHYNSLTQPTQLTHAHFTLTRSPTCSPHTSQLTHSLHGSSKATPCSPYLTIAHPWPPHHHHAPTSTLKATI